MFLFLRSNPFGRANLLVSRHVFIFEVEPVWEGEPPGEPHFICAHVRSNLAVSRHVFISEVEPVWEVEPRGEPACFYF